RGPAGDAVQAVQDHPGGLEQPRQVGRLRGGGLRHGREDEHGVGAVGAGGGQRQGVRPPQGAEHCHRTPEGRPFGLTAPHFSSARTEASVTMYRKFSGSVALSVSLPVTRTLPRVAASALPSGSSTSTMFTTSGVSQYQQPTGYSMRRNASASASSPTGCV